MQDYELLDWDTKILGVATAKILPAKLTSNQLKKILHELQTHNINLVYWASDSEDQVSQQAATEAKGFLADRKVTYWLDLTHFTVPDYDASRIESYLDQRPIHDLQELAIAVGLESRFKMDPKISFRQLEAVYHTWLENSIKRKIAKEVLVIRKGQRIVAMTTLGEKNGRGDIGLLAVNPDYRGQQLGKLLVHASQRWCKDQGYSHAQVVTQKANAAACKLYESCGYKLEKIEHFYHFWL